MVNGYDIEVRHEGLHKYRHIRGSDRYVVAQKARTQIAAWDEQWQKQLIRQQASSEKQARKEQADNLTQKSQQAIENIRNTLTHTILINDAIVWDKLKDFSPFTKLQPSKPELLIIPPEPQKTDMKSIAKPEMLTIPPEPQKTDSKYIAKLRFWDKIFLWWGEKKMVDAETRFEQDRKEWVRKKGEIHQFNSQKATQYKNEVRLCQVRFEQDRKEWERQKVEIFRLNNQREEEYKNKVQQWEAERQEFPAKQQENNALIDRRKEEYLKKMPDAVMDYCDMVLANSQYPDDFPQEYEMDYNPETRILLVDYALPPIECLPTVKEVRYIQTRNELKETLLTEKELNSLYDDLLYQITIRTIHELYEADVVDALEAIIFNGWVRSLDKSTGKEVNACILSIQAGKKEFLEFDLTKVDPKACFKKLKGVGSSQLSGLAQVAPILTLNREDKRFVQAYEVANRLNEGYNLATMDWKDFENLIRQIFEKEFSQAGGEVKITQASRDGGVDAVAFDPDPIRGGKIVIQAKRYTNPVGVSAVRDLYGTVLNEGATKGILVTTSDYGPDSYEFSRDKPLTLLNGSNLLHLLNKHGHKARIDLKEAKQILGETDQPS